MKGTTHYVLVVWRKDSIADSGSKVDLVLVFRVDRSGRQDPGCAGLKFDLARLVDHPVKDVLVVGDGDDGLQLQLALSDERGLARSVVGMLPLDTGIDFVAGVNVISLPKG